MLTSAHRHGVDGRVCLQDSEVAELRATIESLRHQSGMMSAAHGVVRRQSSTASKDGGHSPGACLAIFMCLHVLVCVVLSCIYVYM